MASYTAMSGMGTCRWQMGYGLGLDFDRLSNPDTDIGGHIRIMKAEWNSQAIAGIRLSSGSPLVPA